MSCPPTATCPGRRTLSRRPWDWPRRARAAGRTTSWRERLPPAEISSSSAARLRRRPGWTTLPPPSPTPSGYASAWSSATPTGKRCSTGPAEPCTPPTSAAIQPAPFHAPSGTREVPTMRQQERMGYAAVDGWRMVTLSTASDVVVDVLLSDEDGRLTPETLTGLYRRSTATRVDLALPRVRVETEAVLNDALGRLGVVTAFTRDADFSGISPAERIWIDKVVHKAVLRVDEQGFEGAAATAVVMRAVAFDLSTPVPFHVDRPFLVVVRHAHTGAIYFLARIVDP